MTNRSLAAVAFSACLLVAACGGSGPVAPGSSAAGSAMPGSSAPASAGATSPVAPLPSVPLVDGLTDPSALEAPILEQGDVPAAEPATQPVKGELTLQTATTLATQTIGSGGGSIRIARPGDPLDGLTITVPAGTYAADVAFTVRERAISSSTFGAGIAPISPLISIENGGATAGGEPVRVTIPATVPAGATVLGLYYQGAGGTLDPLPIVAQDAGSVTLAAAHFSDLLLALVDWTKIAATVDSGFRPGADDWQFTNYGSFVAPGGHCEGQSVTAIWYYTHQRRGGGASPLYGLYDNNGAEPRTPTFWPDDADGYRFASSVQADPIAAGAVYTFFHGLDTASGRLTYNLFRAAIGLTGEPQLIAIADAAGGHGHAMVVYRVTPTRLYVADPNYPGRLRTVAYDPATGVLGPYSSGDNAGAIAAGGATSYARFAYIPAGASSSDAAVAAHWTEFEGGKSGDAAFPAYGLEVWTGKDQDGNDTWEPLGTSYATPDAKLRVRLVVPAGGQGDLRIFAGSTALSAWGTELTVELKDGLNDLGFYEMGVAGGAWRYVDFQRVAVTKGLMDINGTWTGTLTFTDIAADAAAQKEAKDQGCDLAILEALRGKALPMTLDLTADKAGVGEGTFVIDTTSINPVEGSTPSPPEPVTLQLTFAKGLITFDFGDQCGGGSSCAMSGTPAVVAGVDTIEGTMGVKGSGYSAAAEWTVTRDR